MESAIKRDWKRLDDLIKEIKVNSGLGELGGSIYQAKLGYRVEVWALVTRGRTEKERKANRTWVSIYAKEQKVLVEAIRLARRKLKEYHAIGEYLDLYSNVVNLDFYMRMSSNRITPRGVVFDILKIQRSDGDDDYIASGRDFLERLRPEPQLELDYGENATRTDE